MECQYCYLLYVFICFVCLGSFLNVVILRYPKEQNIVFPASRCPHCHHVLKWFHNIPLLSFIFLKKKCAFCQHKISFRYFWIELLTGLIGGFLFYHTGFHFNFLFFSLSIFSLILIILIFIDIDYQLLPDLFTLGLLWLGLLASIRSPFIFTSPQEAILGAVVGYLSLWSVAMIYQYFTKTEGMGYGDFKLLAALGAWAGWRAILPIILIASISGLIAGVYFMIRHKATSKTPLPFGPYLAIAGWIMLIWPHSGFFPLTI